MRQLRAAFITGILVMVPLMATVDILRWFVRGIDNAARNYLPNLPFDFPGLGLFIAVGSILLMGVLTRNFVGQWIVGMFDVWMKRTPVVGGIYGAIKKFLETIFNPHNDKFSGAALVPFPREGIYSIGFRTGKPTPEIQAKDDTLVNIFVPCTPNPTSGFYIMVPEKQLIPLQMSVQEAFKIVISMGIVTSEEVEHK